MHYCRRLEEKVNSIVRDNLLQWETRTHSELDAVLLNPSQMAFVLNAVFVFLGEIAIPLAAFALMIKIGKTAKIPIDHAGEHAIRLSAIVLLGFNIMSIGLLGFRLFTAFRGFPWKSEGRQGTAAVRS